MVEIGESTGLYENDTPEKVMQRYKRAKGRSTIQQYKYKGQRGLRSVKTEYGNEFVHIFDSDVVTKEDLDQLITAEGNRILESRKNINYLRRTGRWIDGQITLEEVFNAASV